MQTNDINNELKNYKCFKGTYARDILPKEHCDFRPIAFVINTDPSIKPGQHWVALFIDSNNNAEYFDSFGYSPIFNEVFDLVKFHKVKKFSYNKYKLQSVFTSTCGAYCVLFIKMRCKGKSFNDFVSMFGKNRFMNDLLVSQTIE